jgi:hypothetical protein
MPRAAIAMTGARNLDLGISGGKAPQSTCTVVIKIPVFMLQAGRLVICHHNRLGGISNLPSSEKINSPAHVLQRCS